MTPQQLEALEKLSLLLKSGAINETEFEDLKRKALSEPETRSADTVDWDRSVFDPSNPTPLQKQMMQTKAQKQVVQTKAKIENAFSEKVASIVTKMAYPDKFQPKRKVPKHFWKILIGLNIAFAGMLAGIFLFVESPGGTQTKPTTVMDIMNAPMPDVRCMNLQRAQDTIQARTSTFYIRSRDGSGRGRKQIVDSNWIVIGQIPAAGSSLKGITPMLTVVKPGEPKDNC